MQQNNLHYLTGNSVKSLHERKKDKENETSEHNGFGKNNVRKKKKQ